MPKIASFVLERSNNPGTGPFALSGAPPGRRGWSGAFEDGEVYYFADDGTQGEWGIGRLIHGQPAVITRDRVLGTTQDRADRLNFTGLVYVYSDLPAEVVPPPATQARVSLSEMEANDQPRDLYEQRIKASGTTVHATFAATAELRNTSGITVNDWAYVFFACSIYRYNAAGEASLYTAEARRYRATINGPTALMVDAMAVNLPPGETVGAVLSLNVLARSRNNFDLRLFVTDAGLTWLSV